MFATDSIVRIALLALPRLRLDGEPRASCRAHFAHYNLVPLRKTLRLTPAMAANVTDRLWLLEELVDRTCDWWDRAGMVQATGHRGVGRDV